MTTVPRRGRRPTTGRPSMTQVAQKAGVSLGTVSHVLNHPERVTEATRARVRAAMAELRFQRSAAARTLAGGTSDAIGLVLTDLGNSLFVDVARGASREAAMQGMHVLLADGDNERGRELSQLEVFEGLHVAGSMVTLNEAGPAAELLEHRRPGRPLVLLNIGSPSPDGCSVEVDHVLGGRLATEHLLSIGRRRLALVGGSTLLMPVAQRRDGFLATLTRMGLRPAWMHEEARRLGRADGRTAGRALASEVRAHRVDAAFVVSDMMAAGILEVLREEGIDVPGQVALVGYDDNLAARDVPVPLTTLAQPGDEMGRCGARMVIDEARRPAEHVHRQVVLRPELRVRESTGG